MDEPLAADLVCPECARNVTREDAMCPDCGAELATKAAPRAARSVPLTENPRLIVALMVFAALFLGFPLLWRSRHFSWPEKVFWTVFVLAETTLLCSAVWWAVARLLTALRQAEIL